MRGLVRGGARFNRDRSRRRLLWRHWSTSDRGRDYCCFVCLNPSTADEKTNDHSVTKMIGFADRAGCLGLFVVNLFDIRSTDPQLLYRAKTLNELTSKENDAEIVAAVNNARLTICAWGGHGTLFGRDRQVLDLIRTHRLAKKLHVLRINSDGTPAHPLRLPYSCRPIKFGD